MMTIKVSASRHRTEEQHRFEVGARDEGRACEGRAAAVEEKACSTNVGLSGAEQHRFEVGARDERGACEGRAAPVEEKACPTNVGLSGAEQHRER